MMKRIALFLLLLLAPCTWQLTPAFAQQPISPTSVSTFDVDILTPALAPVAQVSASVIGNGGAATYYYWIVARYAQGNATPSSPALVISAPNTLTGANFIRVSWNAVPNATGYDVLRTTTAQLPSGTASIAVALNVAATMQNDTGGALLAYSLTTLKPRQISLQLQSPFMDLLGASQPPVSSAGRARYYFDSATNQMMLSVNGGVYVPFGSGAGSGIKTLNGLSAVDQFLTTCTNGLDFNISPSIDTNAFCIPDASATARGLMTTGAQVFGGNKVFNNDLATNGVFSALGISSQAQSNLSSVTFTGAGLNDLIAGGIYTADNSTSYCVKIDGTTPDTFSWGTGGSCVNGALAVAITGAAQNLSDGITVTFLAVLGHTLTDQWDFTASEVAPLMLLNTSGNTILATHNRGTTSAFRVSSSGTALVAGDFVPSGGWGNAGSVAVTSASTDQSFHITVTAAGAGQALNPTVAFTFHDGTWMTVPIYVCSMETGGTGALSFFTPDNTSATVLTLTYAGTPVAGLTYEVACNGWGH